ncbi:unnamed protein product [Ixodes pacificus]
MCTQSRFLLWDEDLCPQWPSALQKMGSLSVAPKPPVTSPMANRSWALRGSCGSVSKTFCSREGSTKSSESPDSSSPMPQQSSMARSASRASFEPRVVITRQSPCPALGSMLGALPASPACEVRIFRQGSSAAHWAQFKKRHSSLNNAVALLCRSSNLAIIFASTKPRGPRCKAFDGGGSTSSI